MVQAHWVGSGVVVVGTSKGAEVAAKSDADEGRRGIAVPQNVSDQVASFECLLRDEVGNRTLIESVLTLQSSVDAIVNAWCAGCAEPDRENFRRHGSELLGQVGHWLNVWRGNSPDVRSSTGASIEVPCPGILAVSENGALQIGAGEVGLSVPTRKHGSVTEIGCPNFNARDALRALGRLKDQLSPGAVGSEGLVLRYHPDAHQACRAYTEAVSTAVLAISRARH